MTVKSPLYGIGVSNMQAGDAAYYCAVKTLSENAVKLKGDVMGFGGFGDGPS